MAGTDFTTTITGTVTGFDVSPITNMNNALRTVPSAAQQASGAGNQLNASLQQVSTTSRATGASVQGTGALVNAFGGNINNAHLSAQQLVGTNGALGNSFGSVTTGGLNANNTLVPLNTNLQQTATQSQATEGSTVSLGEKIGLMAGFITTTIGSVGGLIEGFTGLEASQVAAQRAQDRVNTSELAAVKAQDNYNKMVDKFGPSSKQAQEALTNMQNKQNAANTAEERAQVTQSRLNEAYLNFGLEVITVAGELAQMGSTVSILVGKLGLKTAATVVDTDANIANFLSAKSAQVGLDAEEAAALRAATGMKAASVGGAGLTAELLAIAAPAVAAIALFALIETNTFGMGDAFRSITPAIGTFVQDIVNGLTTVFNAFVELGNGVEVFRAEASNVFVGVHDAIANFFNQTINDANTFQQQFSNAFREIYNFIVTQVINNIITAWNAFMKSLTEAANSGFSAVTSVIRTAMSGALTVVEDVVGSINSALHVIGQHQLDPFENDLKSAQTELTNTGNTATQAGNTINTSFGQISTIKPLQIDVRNLNTETIPLIGTYQDVGAASHTWDSLLKPLNTTIGQTVTNTLNFASKGENLASVFNNNVKPAFANVIKNVGDFTAGLFNSGTATDQTANKTGNYTGQLVKAAKAQKDLTTELDNTIAKEKAESAAMLASINNGQQYQKTLADLSKAYADVAVKLTDNTIKLTDATAIQERHTIAVADGINKALEFGIKVQDDATSTVAYNKALDEATGFSESFGKALPPTTDNLEKLSKAIAGDGKAAEDLVGSFIDASNGVGTASQQLVDDVSKAFTDIGHQVTDNDALAKIPPALEKVLSPEALDLIALEGRWKAVTTQLVEGFSAEFLAAGDKFSGAGLENVRRYIEGFGSLPAAQAPQIQDFLDGLETALNTASGQSEAAGKLTIEKFLAGVEAAGGGAAQAAEALAKAMGIGPEVATLAAQSGSSAGKALAGGVTDGTGAVPPALQKNIIDPFTGLPSTAQAVATRVGDSFIAIGTALEQLPSVMLRLFTSAFVTSLLNPLGKASTAIGNFVNSSEVAISNMVTTINSTLAGIKTPTLTPIATPTIPSAGPQTPIKIPAPDLTAFEAGLAKMQTDANNAFAAIVATARIQFTGIGAAMTAAAATTQTGLTAIQTNANNAFAAVVNLARIQFAGIGTAMTAAAATTQTGLTAIQTNANNAFAAVANLANIQFAQIGVAMTTAVNGANPALATLQTNATNAFNAVVNLATSLIPPGILAAFTTAVNDINTPLSTLQTNATNAFNAVVNLAKSIIPTAAAAFITFVNGVNPALSTLQTNNSNAFNAVVNLAKSIVPGAAAAWITLSNSIIPALDAIQRNSSNAWNAVKNAAVAVLPRVVDQFNNIKTSVNNAISAVNSLISRINQIPTQRTVNVNIVEHVTQVVRTVPAPLATAGAAALTAAIPSPQLTTLGTATAAATSGGGGNRSRVIRLEISEPTIVKINDRELIKQINKKILELDIGALA